jgi:hypothetical protein
VGKQKKWNETRLEEKNKEEEKKHISDSRFRLPSNLVSVALLLLWAHMRLLCLEFPLL